MNLQWVTSVSGWDHRLGKRAELQHRSLLPDCGWQAASSSFSLGLSGMVDSTLNSGPSSLKMPMSGYLTTVRGRILKFLPSSFN